MNEITTKKDVNEILADSKSLTQYLEDVYEVEKNLYSVYQAKQRMEVIINQSGQERVFFTYWKYFADSGSTLLRRTYFTFRRNVDSNIYSIYDRSCLVAGRKCEKLCTSEKSI